MANRKAMVYLKTSGLRKFLELTSSDFYIVELHGKRASGESTDTHVMPNTGVKFGTKTKTFLQINHNRESPPFNQISKKVLKKISELGLTDMLIDSAVIESKKPILKGEKDKIVIRFDSELVKDQKILDKYEEMEYNDKLLEKTRKRSVLSVTQLVTHYQEITIPPKKREYIINVNPNYRDHQYEQAFPEEGTAFDVRDIFHHENSFVGFFKKKRGEEKLILDSVS